MIQITRIEAEYLRKKMPSVSIKRSVHKYYVEDNAAVRNVLRKMIVKAVPVKC